MAKKLRIQSATEKYFCANCEKYFTFLDVQSNWRCPECSELINIKVEINNFIHNCQRVHPNELKVDEIITLENAHTHQIINIIRQKSNYRVALSEYGVITLSSDDIITRVDGSWSRA